MKRFFRSNGLSLVMLALFLAFHLGQICAGRLEYNEDLAEWGRPPVGYVAYLGSAHFWEATAENWESEFLQMAGYVWLTVFLFQRGSAESKDPDKPRDSAAHRKVRRDSPWPVRKGGAWARLYSHSLSLSLFALFLISWSLHFAGSLKLSNEEHLARGEPVVGAWRYLGSSHLWFESFQNWQSEFLSIAAMVILSIFLRERDSPESKPVEAPHSATGG